MANRIKGITIEIGGDTTKLDKALAGTNKEISETQRSLKDVERLLKLDPKNTVLLEQKQRLLSKAVSDTSSKLRTLQDAAKGADEALARGTAYDEKFSSLKVAIEMVSNQLDRLQKKSVSVEESFQSGDLSEKKYQAFQRTLEETETKLAALKEEKKALDKEFQGTKLNQKQFDALQREIAQTEQDLEDAKEAVSRFDSAIGKLEPSLQNVSDKAKKVSDTFKPVSIAAGGIVTAAIAAVPATDGLRAGLANIEINAQNAGISVDTATQAMRTMNAVSGDLDGALEATNNLLNAGLPESVLQRAVENLAGAYIKFPETLKLESLADSLQETLATGAATGQFAELLDRLGIGAEKFNGHLEMIPGGVDRWNYTLGLLAHEGLLDVYNGWKQNNEQLVQSRDAALQGQLAMARLAETLQPVLTKVTEIATAFLDWFNSLPSGVQAAIGVFLLLIATISPIAGIIQAIGLASTVSGVAFSKWAIIIMGVVLALAALAAIIAIILGKGDEMNKTLDNVVGSVSGVNVPSGTTSRRGAAPSVLSMSDLPGFASGGVFMPNSPMLGILGDNPREVEVAAPRSTIVSAVLDAMDMRGASASSQSFSGPTVVEMVMDGTKFARVFIPHLRPGLTRAGIKLK